MNLSSRMPRISDWRSVRLPTGAPERNCAATRSRALSSGNLGLLDSYPVLSAYRRHIEKLSDSGALDQYMPGQNEATTGEVETGRPGLVDYLVG